MTEASYNQAVGRRLRAIRRQKRLSLQDVEEVSSFEFKASVLGAYERGERALSLPRMHRLASVYGVPTEQLLPEAGRVTTPSWQSGGITIDLEKVEQSEGGQVVERFLRAIQLMRQDFNGKVLTLRRSDLRILAGLLESEDGVESVLIDLGLVSAGQ
jgi:transcriptional regulator with XRE-family HTH domain